jgi:hypothetical protein
LAEDGLDRHVRGTSRFDIAREPTNEKVAIEGFFEVQHARIE